MRTILRLRIRWSIPAQQRFEASTPYYYSCYDGINEAVETKPPKKSACAWLRNGFASGRGLSLTTVLSTRHGHFSKAGYETIIVNNNPETVSTDFDIADKLYFEPLTPEDVENIVNIEKPDGAVVQFGGQTAIKLTESLMKMGVPILGTKAEDVDAAEDRELLTRFWRRLRFRARLAARSTRQRRQKRLQTVWVIQCLSDRRMCLADRECRLRFLMRRSRSLWKSSTASRRIIRFS